ncbi:MAG: tetraacyldisaccharide 4'-kinase [Candidatus Omnitrophica bacterium]|nr:tetraacyldisaccharide 4'-kinase [Candidatus Omnitrophota bacterium]
MKLFLYKLATDQIQGFGPGILKAGLLVLSFFYDAIVRLRRIFYKTGIFPSTKLRVPVISIGNLTVGGSGKTPLVQWLAEHLQQKQKKVVILTRGYMPENKTSKQPCSDEAQMLVENLKDIPVLVGADRSRNAQAYLEKDSADFFLLDDGFQHLPLQRGFDVVVIDCTNPWGNGCVLPRGILRESISTLKKAAAVILTKTDQNPSQVPLIQEKVRKVNPNVLVLETSHQPKELIQLSDQKSYNYDKLKEKKVCIMCSIGSPASFVQTVRQCGYIPEKQFLFMDHHHYRRDEVAMIIEECQKENINAIVTTQKDAVKLRAFMDQFAGRVGVYALKISIIFKENEDVLIERILNLS